MLQSALQHIPHTTYHVMAALATVAASNQQVTRATGVSIRHASTSIHKCRNGQKQSKPVDALTPMIRLPTKSPPVFGSRSFLEGRPLTPHRQWLIWITQHTRARFLSVRWTCRMSDLSTLILLRVPFPSSLPSCGTGGRQSC